PLQSLFEVLIIHLNCPSHRAAMICRIRRSVRSAPSLLYPFYSLVMGRVVVASGRLMIVAGKAKRQAKK
ncbi:hypothetical protein, partial [Aeromonas taiwanensis]|uniref:hypothetical protein n=1 Tax=Aeromonas taiwanensis TaxID=633417 RepID=UPI001E4B69EF